MNTLNFKPATYKKNKADKFACPKCGKVHHWNLAENDAWCENCYYTEKDPVQLAKMKHQLLKNNK